MKLQFSFRLLLSLLILVGVVVVPAVTLANHAWGPYHWARTTNPFTLKLGDNVSSNWDTYLTGAAVDWSASTVLDTTVVTGGTNPKNCRPTNGRVEVCNAKYGNNGWLGLAQIWITGGEHIYQGVTKLNDTYFSTAKYNTAPWRRLVTCQEIGHNFGLNHQDENNSNPNLGTCMDYTSDPDGPPSNEHPNQHDFDQLEAIYANLDSTTTVSQTIAGAAAAKDGLGNPGNSNEDGGENPSEWGRQIKDNGNVGVYTRELGGGRKLFTFVIWAK